MSVRTTSSSESYTIGGDSPEEDDISADERVGDSVAIRPRPPATTLLMTISSFRRRASKFIENDKMRQILQ